MMQGQVFLKGGGDWHFSYLIFSRSIIFTFRNYFTLCKIGGKYLRTMVNELAKDWFLWYYVQTNLLQDHWLSSFVSRLYF